MKITTSQALFPPLFGTFSPGIRIGKNHRATDISRMDISLWHRKNAISGWTQFRSFVRSGLSLWTNSWEGRTMFHDEGPAISTRGTLIKSAGWLAGAGGQAKGWRTRCAGGGWKRAASLWQRSQLLSQIKVPAHTGRHENNFARISFASRAPRPRFSC